MMDHMLSEMVVLLETVPAQTAAELSFHAVRYPHVVIDAIFGLELLFANAAVERPVGFVNGLVFYEQTFENKSFPTFLADVGQVLVVFLMHPDVTDHGRLLFKRLVAVATFVNDGHAG